jgi:hypothetical protein
MARKICVTGKGYTCAYEPCGKPLDYIWVRSNIELKMYFCCQDHSKLWREENNFYSDMGKSGQQVTMDRYKEAWVRNGHFKAMSIAGLAGRQRVMPVSNKEKPRRSKRA